jgi:dipeptidyl aminopeptidase/acylaminoacyl peptidase
MYRPRTKTLRALLVTAALALCALTMLGASPSATNQADAPTAPTLQQLFPKSGLLGAPATQVTFSHDGTYGAYVHYRDLYILDTTSNTPFRAISSTTLAKFRSADPDTPKEFAGVFAYTWSPRDNELLLLCEGHLYRYQVASQEITRLTQQRMSDWEKPWSERLYYLPDGSGYLFARGYYQSLLTVWQGNFATGEFKSWTPQLPLGEQLLSLELSPDGRQLVMTTRRGLHPMLSSGSAKISSYRDRFMQVQTVPRAWPGEPLPDCRESVFVAPLASATDAASLVRVWSYTYTSRADAVSPPSWSPDSRKLTFARYSQTRHDFEILQVEVQEQRVRNQTFLEAREPRVVTTFEHTGGSSTPAMLRPWFLADSRNVVFVSERSGFLHLHRLDTVTGSATALTSGNFEVYPLALTADRSAVYVAATREGAQYRHLYCVDAADGRMQRLTAEPGTYGIVQAAYPSRIISVAFSPDGKNVLASYASFGKLRELVRIDVRSGRQTALTLSHWPLAQKLATARPEFFSYRNRHGDEIHGYLFKPHGWQKTDQRPALLYVYAGALGIDKMVMDGDVSPDHLFASYMAEKHGYVTVVIDPRGSSGYGAKFEKANYDHPGQAQVEDLEDGVQFLVENYGVDAKRVGLHGWSFGGFTTQMCMYTSDRFAVGIAGAGPTEWQNYNDWYTMSVIGGTRKLKRFSLLPLAANLQGKLLLVHGMEDDNVLLQDTIHIYSALLRAGKVTQVELFLDPSGRHGLRGDVWDLDKYRKYEQFLLQNLGSGNPAPPAASGA